LLLFINLNKGNKKMREYGSVKTQFWSDLAHQNLSTHAKLLTVYLLTGSRTNMLGCFRLPISYVAEDLRWEREIVCKAFTELTQIGFLIRDTESSWVLIPNFLVWNPIENPNQGKSLSKLFSRIPQQVRVLKPLLNTLLAQTKYLEEGFQNRLNRLYQLFRNQEQKQEQDVVGAPSDDGLLSSNSKSKNTLLITQKRKSTHDETITVPLKSGLFVIMTAEVETWKKTYPDICVLQELRQLSAWNEANPTERKTRSQILCHINAWLAKEQRNALQPQQACLGDYPPVGNGILKISVAASLTRFRHKKQTFIYKFKKRK
jgi:hypothetical protein